jgi:CTP synthase (UTP-ammonia lyase)
LVEKSGVVRFVAGSRLRAAYGVDEASEGYRCNYGLNVAYRRALEEAGLRFTAFDEDGAVRGAELPDHPFFVGTLFQPERAALRGQLPAVVKAFVDSI